MNFSSIYDERLQQLYLDLVTTLSLSESQQNQVPLAQHQEDSDSGEDNPRAVRYLEECDEHLQLAIAISKTDTEEEDVETAVQLSQMTYQEARQMLPILESFGLGESGSEYDAAEQPNARALPQPHQQNFTTYERTTLSIEQHFYDTHCPSCWESKELPDRYKDYRLLPTMFCEDEMWPKSAISLQQRELKTYRGNEEVREWREPQSENDRCLVCLSNVATRVAVPCGHKLCCRLCLPSLTDKASFYSVTTADGEVVNTDYQLPLQCFVCRAILGQIVALH